MKKGIKKFFTLFLCLCLASGFLNSCKKGEAGYPASDPSSAPFIAGLVYQDKPVLEYARCFEIFRYRGGYSLIVVDDGRRYLTVPEGAQEPEGAEGCIILRQPLNSIYLAASAAMSLVCGAEGLDRVSLSGTREENWYVEEAARAMAEGKILYGGKYSEPDYELMLAADCDLAVESTMILHAPEVQEKIEELGIPVLVDRSSYEPHPLGRTEWVKVYGELLGTAAEAEAFFARQSAMAAELSDFPNTEKTVAFFYINNNGAAVVRESSDYVAFMINMAGGRYIFENLDSPGESGSSITMTMEEFYAGAKDADYIIYNTTIDHAIGSLEDMLEKSRLLEEFKAVKEGNVWVIGANLYQAAGRLAQVVKEMHQMLTGGEGVGVFLRKLR